MVRDDELPACVARGAALLDAQVPRWWTRINPATLDLHVKAQCVLGQTCGSYEDALCRFAADEAVEAVWQALPEETPITFAQAFGFDASPTGNLSVEMYIEANHRQFAILKQLWLAEVDRRHAADARSARTPPRPEALVGALQDRIHPASGRLRAARRIDRRL